MAEATETSTSKPHIGIVIIGHVDAGKSTTTSHLLFKLGAVSQREMDRLEAKAKELGKESFKFAFLTDNNKAEQERGITIACNTKEFYTDNYHYSIVDAPGHRDFVNNMITGSSSADVALLLVPADGFEQAIASGKGGGHEGQTRQHAHLVNLFGVKQVIVGVNKMDSVKYDQARFDEIKSEMLNMLKECGYKKPEDRIPIIPMSGFEGENLTEPSKNMPWYTGFDVATGPKERAKGVTVVDALNNFVKVPKRNVDGAPRMAVSNLYKISGIGYVAAGSVKQGTVEPGAEVTFIPSRASGKVQSVQMHHKDQPRALPGDNVGLNVKFKGELKPNKSGGDVMVLSSDPRANKFVKTFTAQVNVLKKGKIKPSTDGKGGYTPIVFVGTSHAACKVQSINWRQGKKTTGGAKEENPTVLEYRDTAEVVFEPQQHIFLEAYKDCQSFGRTAIMDSNALAMVGQVTAIELSDYKK